MNWLTPLISALTDLIGRIIAFYAAFKAGKSKQKLEQAEDILDDVAKANAAKSDPDNVARVRNKYR